ncbi:DUF1648 domain-containing protein [Flagellimonas iocasae]|uniref:DUF1648 domain-containing protein n=1 Tax=Flagellimonas iocasae TaxID=2055905 RepID=A0ABW4Y1E9_9FLAO
MSLLRKNPKIEVKPSPLDKKLFMAGWFVVILNAILVLKFYFDLPETIPTHFNLQGRVDGYGHKSTLWAIPMLSAGLYLAMGLMATKMKPWHMNYPVRVTTENAPKLYPIARRMLIVMNLCFVVAFLITTVIILFNILGWVHALDIKALIALWVLNGLLPLYYVFKMYRVAKR